MEKYSTTQSIEFAEEMFYSSCCGSSAGREETEGTCQDSRMRRMKEGEDEKEEQEQQEQQEYDYFSLGDRYQKQQQEVNEKHHCKNDKGPMEKEGKCAVKEEEEGNRKEKGIEDGREEEDSSYYLYKLVEDRDWKKNHQKALLSVNREMKRRAFL